MSAIEREGIIVYICWRLSNLKKTHIGDPQRPSAAEVRLPMFEVPLFEWVGHYMLPY